MVVDHIKMQQKLQNCLITTSILPLSSFDSFLPDVKNGKLPVYECLRTEDTGNIPTAGCYKILIDFDNSQINEITVAIFNRLMGFACNLHVMVPDLPAENVHNAGECMKLVRKLEKNGHIRLEVLKGFKQAPADCLPDMPVPNAVCFVGPCNTGKTSIVSSVSELFGSKNQKVALLDLTAGDKLAYYFTDSTDLSEAFFSGSYTGNPADDPNGGSAGAGLYLKNTCNTDLYTFKGLNNAGRLSAPILRDAVGALSKAYDYVLVNADEAVVDNFTAFFRLFGKIFIVHDCVINKIHSSHNMLLKLNKAGIDTLKTVSIIYNKVVKAASDIGMVEEDLIFEGDENGHLIPLVDIHCNTFEILLSAKTMAALNRKITMKTNAVEGASRNYRSNINGLYRLINDYSSSEFMVMRLREYIDCHAINSLRRFFTPNLNRLLRVFGIKKCIFTNEKIA